MLKEKRVVEMLRIATEFANSKSNVFDIIAEGQVKFELNYITEQETDDDSARKMKGADAKDALL